MTKNKSDSQPQANQEPTADGNVVQPSMPRWFELHAEIDHAYYRLEEVCKLMAYRQPIEQLIDQATGFDNQMDSEAREWATTIKTLRAEHDALTNCPLHSTSPQQRPRKGKGTDVIKPVGDTN